MCNYHISQICFRVHFQIGWRRRFPFPQVFQLSLHGYLSHLPIDRPALILSRSGIAWHSASLCVRHVCPRLTVTLCVPSFFLEAQEDNADTHLGAPLFLHGPAWQCRLHGVTHFPGKRLWRTPPVAYHEASPVSSDFRRIHKVLESGNSRGESSTSLFSRNLSAKGPFQVLRAMLAVQTSYSMTITFFHSPRRREVFPSLWDVLSFLWNSSY